MTTFDSILDTMRQTADGWSAHGPENWLQGRTMYGGLSAALALDACERAVPDLPPLRAAQIGFIGPASQDVVLVPTLLRRGRSVTFMGCDLFSEGKVALRALFTFGAARESVHAAKAPPPPPHRSVEDSMPLWGPHRPAFTANIDQRLAGDLMPMAGADRGELLVWVRHSQPVRPGMAALVALGDALPPASFTRFTAPTVISTITWSFELFEPEPPLRAGSDGNGWVLLHSADDGVSSGYAGQSMGMWDAGGQPILRGRQSVAIFG